jgi:multisubunit Na+/H+ antiporter MnhE subunit
MKKTLEIAHLIVGLIVALFVVTLSAAVVPVAIYESSYLLAAFWAAAAYAAIILGVHCFRKWSDML